MAASPPFDPALARPETVDPETATLNVQVGLRLAAAPAVHTVPRELLARGAATPAPAGAA